MTGVIIRKISELILVPLSGNKMSFVYCTPSSEDTWNGGQTRQCLGLPLDSSLLAQASSELPVTLPPATEPQQLPFFLHQVIPLLTLHVLPHPLRLLNCTSALKTGHSPLGGHRTVMSTGQN